MTGFVLLLLQIFLLVLVGRAVMSWFPLRSGGVAASVNSALFTVTEPVLRPVRRVVPRTGMLDLSFLVVFFGVIILQQLVASLGVFPRTPSGTRAGQSTRATKITRPVPRRNTRARFVSIFDEMPAKKSTGREQDRDEHVVVGPLVRGTRVRGELLGLTFGSRRFLALGELVLLHRERRGRRVRVLERA